MTRFEVAASPPLPQYGGPDELDPDSFIFGGELGLRGAWVQEGEVFVAVFENIDEGYFADVDNALAELERQYPRGSGRRAVSPERASRGELVLQEHGPDVIHVEYAVEDLRGRRPGRRETCQDREVEQALVAWLADNERQVAAAYRDREGELR